MIPDEAVRVRYLVHDVEEAVDFYVNHLGFEPVVAALPAFAAVRKGAVHLLLSGPLSSAGRRLADNSAPGPGGWNRIQLVTTDIKREIDRLASQGVALRSEVIEGPGGQQILIEDPAGNLIELFQPGRS